MLSIVVCQTPEFMLLDQEPMTVLLALRFYYDVTQLGRQPLPRPLPSRLAAIDASTLVDSNTMHSTAQVAPTSSNAALFSRRNVPESSAVAQAELAESEGSLAEVGQAHQSDLSRVVC